METNKGGRPPVEIDELQLEKLMQFNPSLKDTAAFFKCNESTITRHIQSNYGLGFAEFRDQKLVHTRMNLVQRALSKAIEGNSTVMLIFCLKNLCGWSDKTDIKIDQEQPFILSYESSALKKAAGEG